MGQGWGLQWICTYRDRWPSHKGESVSRLPEVLRQTAFRSCLSSLTRVDTLPCSSPRLTQTNEH